MMTELSGARKWLLRPLLVLLGTLLLAVLVVWVWGGAALAKRYPIEERDLTATVDGADLHEGERLARLYGCFDGCHGNAMQGNVMFEHKLFGRLVAPNLSRSVHAYSETELEAMIRQGVRPDGRSLFVMPSDTYALMSDAELAAIIAFLRYYPEQQGDPGYSSYGLQGRFELIRQRDLRPQAELVRERLDNATSGPMGRGEYLASILCTGCHAPNLQGREDFAPPLTALAPYTERDFAVLMREGMGLHGRDVGLMGEVARTHFSSLTDAEIGQLHGYLDSL